MADILGANIHTLGVMVCASLTYILSVPVESIYEPNYETGRAVRWRIGHRDGMPLGIAGIWERRGAPGGVGELLSFSMLTVNADGDPLMQRFHRPQDEKRSVVFLHPDQYDAWLDAPLADAPDFLRLFPAAELVGLPAPSTRATSSSPARQTSHRTPAPVQASMFDDPAESG
jgi:putative SOS response-associated peptidase YedK